MGRRAAGAIVASSLIAVSFASCAARTTTVASPASVAVRWTSGALSTTPLSVVQLVAPHDRPSYRLISPYLARLRYTTSGLRATSTTYPSRSKALVLLSGTVCLRTLLSSVSSGGATGPIRTVNRWSHRHCQTITAGSALQQQLSVELVEVAGRWLVLAGPAGPAIRHAYVHAPA